MQPQQMPGQYTDPNAVQPDYSFITNPAQPPKKKFTLPGGTVLGKVILIGGVLVIVMVGFTLFKSLTAKPDTSQYFIAVAQDQQSIVHVASAALAQQGRTTSTTNSAITVKSTVTSANALLTAYLQSSGTKFTPAQMNAKISKLTDTQLTNAAAAGTFDSTYKATMDDLLAAYQKDIRIALNQSPGPRGKALLVKNYNDATLLVTQLKN